MKTTVTIKDIAEQLNLSRNTVSKALNGKYVPEETRARVIEKARELNYKQLGEGEPRSEIERARHFRILLLTCKPLNNITFFIPIIKGIENECYRKRHELFQYTFNDGSQTFKSLSEYIRVLNVDGIIAIECFDKELVSKLLNMDIPMCFVDFTVGSIAKFNGYDIIGTDDSQVIFEFCQHLISSYEIKRFCFVGDFTHCLSFRERYFGMIQALAAQNVPHSRSDDILRSDKFNYGNPGAVKTEILKLKRLPECFVCGNDFIARTVCNALKLIGVHVPKNCFVVGYDNVPESYSLTPAISTFACNKEVLGAQTVATLSERILSPDALTKKIKLYTRAVERTSTIR